MPAMTRMSVDHSWFRNSLSSDYERSCPTLKYSVMEGSSEVFKGKIGNDEVHSIPF